MISTVTLTLDLTNKTGRVTDTTNYTALGISVASFEAKGLGTIYFQGQQIESKNTIGDPLIDLQSGDTYFDFPLELDVNGEPANGVYKIDYSLRLSTVTIPFAASVTLPSTIGVGPGFEWLIIFLEDGDTIRLYNTVPVFTQQLVTYASGEFVDPDTFLEVDQTITASFPFWSIDITNPQSSVSYVYSGCDKSVAAINFTYDCEFAPNGTFSVASATQLNGQTLTSTNATINYPSWTSANPNFNPRIVVNTLPYTQNTLATGTYTVVLTQVIQSIQDDGLILQYTTSATDEYKVSCTGSLCGLNACIDSLRVAHIAELKANKISKYQPYVDNILMYYTEAQTYKTCGDFDKYNDALNKIKEQLDSSGCDCSCCNEEVYEWIQVNSNSSIESLINEIQYRLNDTEPDENDDVTKGVQEGAIWQDVSTGILYRCTDNTAGNAVWAPYYDPGSIIVTASGVTSNAQPGGIIIGTNVQGNIDSINNFVLNADTSLTLFNAEITDLQNTSVFSVTGNFVDNTDPQNPEIQNPTALQVSYTASIDGTSITTVNGALEKLRVSESNYQNSLLFYVNTPGTVAKTLNNIITKKVACLVDDGGAVRLIGTNCYSPTAAAPTLTLQPLTGVYTLAFPANFMTEDYTAISVTPLAKDNGIAVKAQRISASTVTIMFVNTNVATPQKTTNITDFYITIEVFR